MRDRTEVALALTLYQFDYPGGINGVDCGGSHRDDIVKRSHIGRDFQATPVGLGEDGRRDKQ